VYFCHCRINVQYPRDKFATFCVCVINGCFCTSLITLVPLACAVCIIVKQIQLLAIYFIFFQQKCKFVRKEREYRSADLIQNSRRVNCI